MTPPVLIISSEFPPGPGGIGHHCFSLASALHRQGIPVFVLTQGDYAQPSEIDRFDARVPFQVKRYPRLGWFWTYINRFWVSLRIIGKNRYDRVILTGKFSLWQGWLIKMVFPGVRTLAILHGSEVRLSNNVLRAITRLAIWKSDVLVPVSAFTRSLLPEWIQSHHKKIQIIPNGTEPWEADEGNKKDGARLCGTPILLTVGHVSPRKGQHRVIRALPRLLESFPDIHYHIAGLPLQRAELEHLAAEINVLQHITFHGRIPEHKDLQGYYRQADVLLLLSENQSSGDVEGFGIVALEANYFGIPVIGAKYCGIEDAVLQGKSGYLVDGNRPEEILEALQQCLHNKEALKLSCREWALSHSWGNLVKAYIALLK
jgi:phosphatidylinositol alpha-1,6-mannosyltransferase